MLIKIFLQMHFLCLRNWFSLLISFYFKNNLRNQFFLLTPFWHSQFYHLNRFHTLLRAVSVINLLEIVQVHDITFFLRYKQRLNQKCYSELSLILSFFLTRLGTLTNKLCSIMNHFDHENTPGQFLQSHTKLSHTSTKPAACTTNPDIKINIPSLYQRNYLNQTLWSQ